MQEILTSELAASVAETGTAEVPSKRREPRELRPFEPEDFQIFSIGAAARLVGVGRGTLRKYAIRGLLPFLLTEAGLMFFDCRAVERFAATYPALAREMARRRTTLMRAARRSERDQLGEYDA